MPRSSFQELKDGIRRIGAEFNELKIAIAVRNRERSWREFKYQLAALRFEAAFMRYAAAYREAAFNPNQPRVPAGSREGGQWAKDENVVDASGASSVTSDVTPDPIAPGTQFAQTQIEIKPEALTGDTRIDNATTKLTATLAGVMDVIEYVPGLTP